MKLILTVTCTVAVLAALVLVTTVSAADEKQDKSEDANAVTTDDYSKRGNVPPRIEKLSAQRESEILKGVTVPDGFDITLFAAPPAVNYPVFVAADLDGTLYVSSDGNSSLGRDPERGRVIRLRDLDHDGRADETKVFCTVDSPRGLLWDHDRLYLMHPPHLSVFFDRDRDGVAEEQKILVKNLAFDYSKRPADHTANGISLGVDGYLYIAGGDFGFMNAEGTDGRRLTHRGGGVIRVRPDGTGLELHSTGTRNILEVAISPRMDMFTRDNTNDGGGWDVRLHHFTGKEDHGYPRLFKNFNDECVQPLADYGGGSGCGAVFIDEPGFGEWNNAPFTADWGTGQLFRHTVSPVGATFEESEKPRPFVKLPRPTDADIDGNSRLYCASWEGAMYRWKGPEVGYIVCIRPRNFEATPLPQYSKLKTSELVEGLESPSYRRRMAAERELWRRGETDFETLLQRGIAARSASRNLLDHLQQSATLTELLAALGHDDRLVVHTAVRCLAARDASEICLQSLGQPEIAFLPLCRALEMMHQAEVVAGLIARLKTDDREQRRIILATLCRLHFKEGQWNGDSWGTRPDTRGPYYQPEAWSESEKIASVLRAELETAAMDDVVFLMRTMQLNRIDISAPMKRLIELARDDDQLLKTVVALLATQEKIPDFAEDVLLKAIQLPSASVQELSARAQLLMRLQNPSLETANAILTVLANLEAAPEPAAREELSRVSREFTRWPRIDTHVEVYCEAARNSISIVTKRGLWAEIALLEIATRPKANPDSRKSASASIESAWQEPARRQRWIAAALKSKNHYLDESILAATQDPNAVIAAIAVSAVMELKIVPKSVDDSPKIGSLDIAEANRRAVKQRGDLVLGEQVFIKANCTACHSISQDETQKGPYLGSIAKTFKRAELATAILEPSHSIAQGFITHVILTLDGKFLTGFVTNELSDRVSLRDAEGKEHSISKTDIDERKTSTLSVMPSGLMNEFTTHEFSSLLDYVESLSKEKSGSTEESAIGKVE